MSDPTTSNLTHQELVREVIKYLQLSSMESREKGMWMLLLPQMEEQKVRDLKACLEKEVNAITDLYLKAMSKQ